MQKILRLSLLSIFLFNGITYSYAKDIVCNLRLLIDNNDNPLEKVAGGGVVVGELIQGIYAKDSVTICSGYTLKQYFKNSVMTTKEATSQKNETYKQLDEAMKWPPTTSINLKMPDGSSKKMTNFEYVTYLRQNLQPNRWIFKEPEMKLTSDKWFIYKKKNKNCFIFIPKKYLAERNAGTDLKKAGLSIDPLKYVDVTPQVSAFSSALPERESDFESKYPTVLQPPDDPTQKEYWVSPDDIKEVLLPKEKLEDDKFADDEKAYTARVKKFLAQDRFVWIVYMNAHGSQTGVATVSEKTYEVQHQNYESSIKFFKDALNKVLTTKMPFTYTTTDLETGIAKTITINPKDPNSIKILKDELKKTLAGKEELELIRTGFEAKNTVIAGLYFQPFQKLIHILSSHVITLCLYFSSCFAGGYNRALVQEMCRRIQMANFIIVAGALTDKEVLATGWQSWHLQSLKSEALRLACQPNVKEYFDILKAYFDFGSAKTDASLEAALKSITDTSKSTWQNKAPFVRIPNGDVFVAAKLDEKIYHLSNVQAKKHELDEKDFDLSKYHAVFLAASWVTRPMTLGQTTIFSISSPTIMQGRMSGSIYIPQTFIATHYLAELINATNNFNQALATIFLMGIGIYKQRFLVEKFRCKDKPAVTNFIIEAKIPGQVTVQWIENKKGYKKEFDLTEYNRSAIGASPEKNITFLAQAIADAPITPVAKDTIATTFDAFKKTIEPEEIKQPFNLTFLKERIKKGSKTISETEKLIETLINLRNRLTALAKQLETAG